MQGTSHGSAKDNGIEDVELGTLEAAAQSMQRKAQQQPDQHEQTVIDHVAGAVENHVDKSTDLDEGAIPGESMDDEEDTAAAVGSMFGGAGDILEQVYLMTSFFQNFSLFTVPDFIDWPDAWLEWIGWLRVFSFGFFHLTFPASPVAAFACNVLVPVVLLTRGMYLVWFMANSHTKRGWIEQHDNSALQIALDMEDPRLAVGQLLRTTLRQRKQQMLEAALVYCFKKQQFPDTGTNWFEEREDTSKIDNPLQSPISGYGTESDSALEKLMTGMSLDSLNNIAQFAAEYTGEEIIGDAQLSEEYLIERIVAAVPIVPLTKDFDFDASTELGHMESMDYRSAMTNRGGLDDLPLKTLVKMARAVGLDNGWVRTKSEMFRGWFVAPLCVLLVTLSLLHMRPGLLLSGGSVAIVWFLYMIYLLVFNNPSTHYSFWASFLPYIRESRKQGRWFLDDGESMVTGAQATWPPTESSHMKMKKSSQGFKKSFDDRFKQNSLNGWSKEKSNYAGKVGIITKVFGDETVTIEFDDGTSFDGPFKMLAACPDAALDEGAWAPREGGTAQLLKDKRKFKQGFERFKRDKLNGWKKSKETHCGQVGTINKVYGDRTVTMTFDDGKQFDFPFEVLVDPDAEAQKKTSLTLSSVAKSPFNLGSAVFKKFRADAAFLTDPMTVRAFKFFIVLLGAVIYVDADDDQSLWMNFNNSSNYSNATEHFITNEERTLSEGATIACYLVGASWICGSMVIGHKILLRGMLATVRARGGDSQEFFRSWLLTEIAVLMFLFTATYIGAFTACLNRVIESDNSAPSAGLTIVAWICTPIFGLCPIILLAFFARYAHTKCENLLDVNNVPQTATVKWKPAKNSSGTLLSGPKQFKAAFRERGFSDDSLNGWSAEKDQYRGQKGSYISVFDDGTVTMKFEDGESFDCPNEALEECPTGAQMEEQRLQKHKEEVFAAAKEFYEGDDGDSDTPVRIEDFFEDGESYKLTEQGWNAVMSATKAKLEMSASVLDNVAACVFSLIQSYESRYWWVKPFLMFEKAIVACVVLGFDGTPRLVGAVAIAFNSMMMSMLTRPYLGAAEDRTDLISRASIFATVGTGAALQRDAITTSQANTILMVNSLIMLGVFVFCLGPVRVVNAILDFVKRRYYKHKWTARDKDTISTMTAATLTTLSEAEMNEAANSQIGYVLSRLVELGIDLNSTNFPNSIPVCSFQLPTREVWTGKILDVSRGDANFGQAVALAAWIQSTAGAAVAAIATRFVTRQGISDKYWLRDTDAFLDLRNKNLGSPDIVLLASWIKKTTANKCLTWIDVSDNALEEDDGKLLVQGLKQSANTAITRIVQNGNEFEPLTEQFLKQWTALNLHQKGEYWLPLILSFRETPELVVQDSVSVVFERAQHDPAGAKKCLTVLHHAIRRMVTEELQKAALRIERKVDFKPTKGDGARLIDNAEKFVDGFSRFVGDNLNGWSEAKAKFMGSTGIVTNVYGDETVTMEFEDGQSMSKFDFPWEVLIEPHQEASVDVLKQLPSATDLHACVDEIFESLGINDDLPALFKSDAKLAIKTLIQQSCKRALAVPKIHVFVANICAHVRNSFCPSRVMTDDFEAAQDEHEDDEQSGWGWLPGLPAMLSTFQEQFGVVFWWWGYSEHQFSELVRILKVTKHFASQFCYKADALWDTLSSSTLKRSATDPWAAMVDLLRQAFKAFTDILPLVLKYLQAGAQIEDSGGLDATTQPKDKSLLAALFHTVASSADQLASKFAPIQKQTGSLSGSIESFATLVWDQMRQLDPEQAMSISTKLKSALSSLYLGLRSDENVATANGRLALYLLDTLGEETLREIIDKVTEVLTARTEAQPGDLIQSICCKLHFWHLALFADSLHCAAFSKMLAWSSTWHDWKKSTDQSQLEAEAVRPVVQQNQEQDDSAETAGLRWIYELGSELLQRQRSRWQDFELCAEFEGRFFDWGTSDESTSLCQFAMEHKHPITESGVTIEQLPLWTRLLARLQ
eukprot:COSAG01_NODE_2150_length_8295_cov_54.415447_1_plen_1992_part_00